MSEFLLVFKTLKKDSRLELKGNKYRNQIYSDTYQPILRATLFLNFSSSNNDNKENLIK